MARAGTAARSRPTLVLAIALAVAAPSAATADDAAVALNHALGLRASAIVPIAVDWRPGRPLRPHVEWEGRVLALDLAPHSVRSPRYAVRVVAADGTLRSIAPGPVNTYRGTVAGDPASRVTAAVIAGGLHALIETGGERLWVEPATRWLPAPHARTRPDARHVVYRERDVRPRAGSCAVNDAMAIARVAPVRVDRPPGRDDAGGRFIAELACDADFEFSERWGDETEARINAIINQVNVQYERDVAITHEVVAILVRAGPTYSSTDAGVLLNQLRSRWLIHHGDIARDVTHLFSGKDLDQGAIGIAWVSTICDSLVDGFGFGLAQSDYSPLDACVTDLTAHELGHNWGAAHCNCPTHTMHPFATCANAFAPPSIDGIIAHRDTRTCLDLEVEGYCPARSDDADNDHVARLALAGLDHASGPSGYSDFTDVTTTLGRATRHAVTVELGGPRYPSDIGGLWIDWNADEDFDDDGETITAAWAGTGPYTAPVDVPGTATLGPTRLRLRIQDGQFDPDLTACGTTLQGEVEDYTIVVIEACPGDVDGSGTVDFGDVLAILAVWGPCSACVEDVDGSGIVDFGDVLDVLAVWGACP